MRYVGTAINVRFPISRDPPEGGTWEPQYEFPEYDPCFQFLGIPPKGERHLICERGVLELFLKVSNF